MLTKTNADFKDVTQDAHHSLPFFQPQPDGEGSGGVVGSSTQAVSRQESWLACSGTHAARNMKMSFK